MAPGAVAHAASGGTGGAAAVGAPSVETLKCGTGDATSCPRGSVLRLGGENLAQTRKVVFLGARGARDDRAARPVQSSPHRVLVTVPRSARTGPVRIVATTAASKPG